MGDVRTLLIGFDCLGDRESIKLFPLQPHVPKRPCRLQPPFNIADTFLPFANYYVLLLWKRLLKSFSFLLRIRIELLI